MTNLLSKITTWFQPKKRVLRPKTKIRTKIFLNQASVPPFNSQHYRQLVGKLVKIAIARSRRRKHE